MTRTVPERWRKAARFLWIAALLLVAASLVMVARVPTERRDRKSVV